MKKEFFKLSGMITNTKHVFIVLMAVIITFCIAACDSDDPENPDSEKPTSGIISADELAGKWTLVTDNVLYSEVNPSKQDKVITYSGNSAPLYHFYNVSVSNENMISIVEVSVSGSTIGNSLNFILDSSNLKTSDGKIAGTITHYDKSHSWENLIIEWNKDYSPISFNAPVISTYMLK